MLLLFATLLMGMYRPAQMPTPDQFSTRYVHFGGEPVMGIKPADQAWCLGMPRNWPGCNNGY